MKCLRVASIALLFAVSASAQTLVPATKKPEKHISPQEADKLFRSVDTILSYDAKDTGYPIRDHVGRKLTSREAVEKYLAEKMSEDKDTAKLEQSAVVLEKFGLLPRNFPLRDFLLSLLREQVAGYYDNKSKTVYLLNWLGADEQQPVLAHELTHALQDQYQSHKGIALDKWEDPSPDGISQNFASDREHIRTDESGTAREAVLEGQAMVSYFDWMLNGQSRSLRTMPLFTNEQMQDVDDKDSPILSSAPPVLRESLLFSYQEGLIFEQWLLQNRGTQDAFAKVLDRPPDSSWEILHPQLYAEKKPVALLAMPDLHPILEKEWTPYDLGVMGALDVRMLGEVLADKGAGADTALNWDGGIYYAAKSRSDPKASGTAPIALMYLSRWKTPKAADAFARIYAGSLAKRYPGSTVDTANTQGTRQVFHTSEGPAVIELKDRYVFVSQSLPLSTALAVESASFAAQEDPSHAQTASARPQELLGNLRGWLAGQGVMRAALPSTSQRSPRVY